MKKKNRSGVSMLIVAVLAIMAFVRGPEQIWLLASAFVLWGLWEIIPIVVTAQKRNQRKAQRKQAPPARVKEFYIPELTEPVEGVLLRHVNFRISAYLKSAYPDVTWDWTEKDPEQIITRGGTAKIKLFNVPDFNYANIIFNKNASIDCDMMKIVPLAEVSGTPISPQQTAQAPPLQPTDPQVWYELQGRQVLEDLIGDLNSKGHSSLTIKDNGDICIKQAGNEEIRETLKNFPDKPYWNRLVKVFEKEGLAAATTDTGIAVTW